MIYDTSVRTQTKLINYFYISIMVPNLREIETIILINPKVNDCSDHL